MFFEMDDLDRNCEGPPLQLRIRAAAVEQPVCTQRDMPLKPSKQVYEPDQSTCCHRSGDILRVPYLTNPGVPKTDETCGAECKQCLACGHQLETAMCWDSQPDMLQSVDRLARFARNLLRLGSAGSAIISGLPRLQVLPAGPDQFGSHFLRLTCRIDAGDATWRERAELGHVLIVRETLSSHSESF